MRSNSLGPAPAFGERKRFRINDEMTRNLQRRFGLAPRAAERGRSAAQSDLPQLRRRSVDRAAETAEARGVLGLAPRGESGSRIVEPGARAASRLTEGVLGPNGRGRLDRTTRITAAPDANALGGVTSGTTSPVVTAIPNPATAGAAIASDLGILGTVGVSASGIFGGASIYVPLYHRHRYRYYGYGYYPYFPYSSYCGYSSIAIGFPYFGYYSLYPYPYLYSYGCDFYSNFYVRFGHFRLSLYSFCDDDCGHYYRGHHHHSYHCHSHGYHYYHLRDCSLCYPYDSSYAIQERVYEESAKAEEKVLDLKPGELSFCEGWVLLRSGEYDRAAEAFYNASVELPESGLVQLYLAIALAGGADYELAGAAAAEANRLNPALITYQWSAEENLGSQERFRKLIAQFAAHGAANPNDQGAVAVQAMLELLSAETDFDDAATSAVTLAFASGDSPLSEALLAEIDRREDGRAIAPEVAARRDIDIEFWLRRPACESIGTLVLGRN